MSKASPLVNGFARPLLPILPASVFALALLTPGTGHACSGTDCIQIWSTEDGGGALAVYWDFTNKKVNAPYIFCGTSDCIFSTIDPGFMTPPDVPPDGYYPLIDGTEVSIEALSLDPGLNVMIQGNKLVENEPEFLGTAPTLHVHPTWGLRLPDKVEADYTMTFILTTDSPAYTSSQEYSLIIASVLPPTPSDSTPTPTPTATPSPTGCPADLNDDQHVTIDELVLAVGAALGSEPVEPAFDLDGDGSVSVSELVAAVEAMLDGCPGVPLDPTLANIQRTIFTPRCAISICHNSQYKAGTMVLEEGQAYDQLVGVEPSVFTAAEAGFLRVDPGDPENSFLLVKINGPPPGEGSRMPLQGRLLNAREEQLIRDWIAQGAQP